MEPLLASATVCSVCGEPLSAKGGCVACLLRGGLDEPLEASSSSDSLVFGDFEIARREDGSFWELGCGAMGVTYRAVDRVLHRTVALKVIETPAATGDSQVVRERFLREARAAAALKHPNVAGIFQFGASPEIDRCYYAMELVEGETLEALVRREGPLKVELALEIAIQVTRALIGAAAQGLIHRDLKPGNIMITRPDAATAAIEVKVIDFGLAKATNAVAETDLTHGGFIGTPSFASPEQFGSGPADARSDIYALGVTLWYALTGQVPYPGKTIEEIRDRQKYTDLPIEQLNERKIPASLIDMVRRTLALDPTQRPASARELMEALESCRAKLAHRGGIRSFRKLAALSAVVALFLVVLVVGLFWWVGIPQRREAVRTGEQDDGRRSAASLPEKSIAVLPFQNLSDDKASAYFASGIQDEILTRLSKIADLKVISRTSTQHYKSAPENLPEIARQLGVAHILEGSVQKSGDAVRVNVQLIKAANDSHLWADTFDRKLTDIFSVESEVAKAIADQLRAHLTGREEQVIAAKPTDNVEAYDAYLRGLAYTLKAYSNANILGAQKYLREAVRLDPKFALGWALLSYVDALVVWNFQPTVALREEARQAAETALTLQPNLGEAVLAKGYYHYYCLKDYDTAVRYFEQARQLLPNSSRIPESLAYVARRRGQWDRSELYFNEAERLDPRNVFLLTQHALSYKSLRRFPEALRKLDQVLDITPDNVATLATKAAIAQAEGDLARAAALLAPLHPAADDTQAFETQVYQAILERRPAQIIPRLKEILAKPDPALGYITGELRFWLGWAQEVAGDHAAAQETWRQARSELESFLKEQPENYLLLGDLALTNMCLGDKAAAMALSERAMAANPIEKDLLDGPWPIEIFARVAAQMGEPDRAIAALQKLLLIPYQSVLASNAPLTPALLRLDPMFDPLRNDLRFQKLSTKPAPAAVPEKSIAVLPLENLSDEKENAFFADGIQDELLSNLAKIKDLKVISRTSVMQYKSGITRNLKEIAQQLGVSNVVEGSVRRSGNHIRVSVQLIDAQTDRHIWVQNYDRTLADSITLQDELAMEIAAALGAALSPQEKARVEAKPTNNPAAYDAYLRGRAFAAGSPWDKSTVENTIQSYQEAVKLDPSFVLAWARLSCAQSLSYWHGHDPSPVRLAAAKDAGDRALALDPNLPETHVALGYYRYWGQRDFTGGLAEFQQAEKGLPNNLDITNAIALVQRRLGHWDEAIDEFRRVVELDPRNTIAYISLATTYGSLRRFPEALATLDRVLAWEPTNELALGLKAFVFWATGDLQAVEPLLANPGTEPRVPGGATSPVRGVQALFQRRYAAARQIVSSAVAAKTKRGEPSYDGKLDLGLIQQCAGDVAAARATYQSAAQDIRRELEKVAPGYRGAKLHGFLGLAYAGLGEAASAVAEGQKAMAIYPTSKDPFGGPEEEENMADIYALLGDADHAIPILKRLLQIPYGGAITPGLLRLDPVWDQIRNDPRFQKLCEEKSKP